MNFIKIISVILVALYGSYAFSANFSYTNVGIDIGQATLEDEIEIFGEDYKNLTYVSLNGSYQVMDNLTLSLDSSSFGREQISTEFRYSMAEFYLNFPISIGENVDVVPFWGSRRDSAEMCNQNVCYKEERSAAGYGVNVNLWLDKGTLALDAGYTNTRDKDFDSELSLGLGYYFDEKQSFRFDYHTEDALDIVSIGYRYQW